MVAEDRRRSARHMLGQAAEVHIGPTTVRGIVQNVSRHGMAVVLPGDIETRIGELVWITVDAVASYAITGTIKRRDDDGTLGLEFEEILTGDAVRNISELPPVDPDEFASQDESQ